MLAGDEGLPLPARVTLVGSQRASTPNAQGTFSFDGLTPGPYQLRVTYLGFVPVDTVLSVIPGVRLQLTIRMISSPVQLSSMTIREKAKPPEPAKPPEAAKQKPPDCGLLIVVSMTSMLCTSPEMLPRVTIREQQTFQGLDSRVLEAAQQAAAASGYIIDRQFQLDYRTWLIVARHSARLAVTDSARIEVVDAGADDTTVRITVQTIAPSQQVERRRARELLTTIRRSLN